MTQDTIKDRLQAARALIDQPEKWTQGVFRRYAGDLLKQLTGDEAAALVPESYCASGAIRAVCATEVEEWKVSRALRCSINSHRLPSLYDFALTTWNDQSKRTHAEVMQAFDRAIEDAYPGGR